LRYNYILQQFIYSFYHSILYCFIVGHCSCGEDDEQVKLAAIGYGCVKYILMQPPRLSHEPADAVPVHRAAEFLFGYGKPRHHRGGVFRRTRVKGVYEPYRKNRKRFPGMEKRMNMLLALEPLIYFERITNGVNFKRLFQAAFVRYSQFMTSLLTAGG
jgi:hypothetical protein